MTHSFPSDFLWGAATASYQIEGAAFEDGKGESIWDRFAHTPGKVLNGDTGDTACDHYHRYPEDIQIMQQLGLNAYRFSTAWPRILPDGVGNVNEAGLAFYDRLVDSLLAAGITPFITLYHWDLPQALQDRQGGWVCRDIAPQFVHYVDVISRRLGDRVKYWATFNEPGVFANCGHLWGVHAPGVQDSAAVPRVVHHQLLAHGMAVPVLRQNVGSGAQIGIVCEQAEYMPATDDPQDKQLAEFVQALQNQIFFDAIFLGHYPTLIEQMGMQGYPVEAGDLDIIHAPIDFAGINYYTRFRIDHTQPPGTEQSRLPGIEYTEMGWEVYPEGLTNVLLRVHRAYAPKALYIMENGSAYVDPAPEHGLIQDPQRTFYLKRHLDAAANAIAQGVPLKGYFAWSLLDNFEWSFGYSKRFGLVAVDFDNGLSRTFKQSALYYRDRIQGRNS